MTTTSSNRMVTAYLSELRAAAFPLGVSGAAVLYEQISAHIDEAVGPDTDRATVEQVLRDLGSPRQVVAEARRFSSPPTPWFRRIPRKGWVAIVVVLALAGAGIGVAVANRPGAVGNLRFAGSSIFGDAWDRAHQHDIDDLTGDQLTVPIHIGHRQSFVFVIANSTNKPQTILGPTPDDISFGENGHQATIGVETHPDGNGGISMLSSVPYASSGTIEPGRYYLVKLGWLGQSCFDLPGSMTGSRTIGLRVRIGGAIRNEEIALPFVLGVSGVKSHVRCNKS